MTIGYLGSHDSGSASVIVDQSLSIRVLNMLARERPRLAQTQATQVRQDEVTYP
jgi:hypothetical protein